MLKIFDKADFLKNLEESIRKEFGEDVVIEEKKYSINNRIKTNIFISIGNKKLVYDFHKLFFNPHHLVEQNILDDIYTLVFQNGQKACV